VTLEEAQSQLLRLADLAHGGHPTLLLKAGKPHAAIVSPALLIGATRRHSFLALRGTGRGLWPKGSPDPWKDGADN
jgi:hypothetical protein